MILNIFEKMIAKKNLIITFILLFLSLLSFIQNIEIDPEKVNWLTYYNDENNLTEIISNSTAKEIRYAVKFLTQREEGKEYEGPFYLKIEISVESDNSPLLCFSHNDPNCESRDIIRKNPNYKSVYVWVNKEQYEDEEYKPYFTVKCTGDVSYCAYNITLIGNERINVEPDFIYSYLVTNKNRNMEYLIDKSKLTPDQRLVICLEGSTSALLKLSDSGIGIINLKSVHCANITTNKNDDTDSVKFSINQASEGDYITLSVHTYENNEDNYGNANKDFNIINTGWLTSYIHPGASKGECFPLTKEILEKSSDYLYITGRIQTKNSFLFITNENGDFIDDLTINDGLFAYVFNNTKKENKYLCLELPPGQDYMLFSLRINDYDNLLDEYDYEEPMNQGEIYRHIIPKGKIGVYHFGKGETHNKRKDYTLNRLKGKSKLYFGECRTFPNCHFNLDDLKNLNKSIPAKINNDMIYSTDKDNNTALGIIKDVMVVHCEDALDKDYCEFDTSLFSNGQDITLLEEKTFSKFLLRMETGNIIVNLQSNKIIISLVIDLMVYSGDVTFSIKETNIEYKQFYLSNKVVFIIYKPDLKLEKVTIVYEAIRNSYFTAKYSIDNYNSEQTDDKFDSGLNYLVQINPTSQSKKKNIHLSSILNYQVPFMVNFFEINCEFEVKRLKKDNNIKFFDGYAQDYISLEDAKMEGCNYEISIKEEDLSNYNNKMCMIYISGIEIDKDNKYEREIVIPQNINQQIIFDDDSDKDFRRVRFTYPIVDIEKDFAIRFNVIDKAHYAIHGYLNGNKLLSMENYHIAVTSMVYMTKLDLAEFCKKDQPCSFILDIEMIEKIVQTDPMLEVTFREVLNIPTYLQKGNAKLDYVCGDNYYYLYTDIGKNDVGEITMNFLREFGNLWVRIVRKDLTTPEIEANWRKFYHLPGPGWDDNLEFNSYTRELKITSKDTEECINGCYLLMTIQINEAGEYVPDYVFYFFSILLKIKPNNITYDKIPKVVIQVDEYIIGCLDIREMDNNTITDFYEIWFPHDSDQVEFDWQSQLASIYINIGGTRPKISEADFILHLSGTDGILFLTKEQILEKAKEKNIVSQNETSIQDVNLVIGVWTNITDSGNHELYSLRVHQHEDNDDENGIEIIEISSDQKHVCRPRKVKYGNDTIYRCLFIIKFNADPSIDNPLFAYGFSSDPISDIYILADFIDIDVYNIFDENELRSLIPTPEDAEFNTDKDGTNYIYIDRLPQDKVLYVNLYSYLENDLAIINSVPVYDSYPEAKLFDLYPNSYTEQLFSCKKEDLLLNFPIKDGLAVTVEVLSGEAEINWKDDIDKFKVKGAGDRIKLFSIFNQLEIKNLNPEFGMANPGFLFFVKYKTRDPSFNYDEVPFGKSTEISYTQTDLPVVLYSKLINIFRGLNMALSFKENNWENDGRYLTSPIDIIVTIYDQNKIYSIKKNKDKDMKPSEEISVKGYYDPAIKTALVYLSKDKIDSYNITENKNPTLYARIDKNPAYKEITFDFFNVEAEISGINDFVPPIEKVYHHGKMGADQDVVYYPLKLDRDNIFLRIEVSLNSNELDFAITDEVLSTTNITFDYFNSTQECGKVTVTLKKPQDKDSLFLTFFRKGIENNNNNNTNNEQLTNYAFKYINAETEKNFTEYKMSNPNLTVIKENNGRIIKCIFNKIHADADNVDITYFIKIMKLSSYIQGEEINTIAVTESPSYVYYYKNPHSLDYDEDKISMIANAENISLFENLAYINVIAHIQQQNIIEYVAYNGIKSNNITIRIKKEDNNNKIQIGQKGVLFLLTDFDTKYNIFNDTYIPFNSEIKDETNNKEYNVNCELWIPKNENIKIICKLNDNLLNSHQNISLDKIEFTYNNINIEIIQEEPLEVEQLNYKIPFLYSDKQIIDIKEETNEDKKYYDFKFKFQEYNNEVLFLERKNMVGNINRTEFIFEDCNIKGNDLTCKLEKEKIIENLYYNGEIFELYYYSSSNGLYKFPYVSDIIINYNISKKEDIYVGVTKLLQNNLDMQNFIPFETNVTSISNVISNLFLYKTNIDDYLCKMKKNIDKPLLFLCLKSNTTINGITTSFGENNTEVILNDIYIKYNFRIQPVNMQEKYTLTNLGSLIMINYPTKLGFNKTDLIKIHLIMNLPENIKGIKLNPNSDELKCEHTDNNTKICSVPKSHFNESGYYYIHYLNGDNKLNIFYDISPILVSIPKDEPKPDEKTTDETKPENKTNLAGIIAGSVIGGLALIGIILFFAIRFYRKKKISVDDFNGKLESALLATNKEDGGSEN